MEDDQQFCLRWNNHQSTLVAVFDTLLEKGTLVDCTLAAEGKFLNAHKVVLSACSPYFEALLSRHYDKHPILILKDVKFQELRAMMDYMYRGEVNISQDQLGALLKAAESLQIKGLSDNKKEDTRKAPQAQTAPPPPRSPPPQQTLPKVQGLTIEQRHRDDSRDGSMSPGPRKKKRMRRKSEELDNHHDASNSSESHSLPPQNIPSTLPGNSEVPEQIETKQEIISRHKEESTSIQPSSNSSSQVPMIKEKLETHTELMLEPKAEYVEEMNEDSIEDLTLDDDDLSNMEQMDDGGAGPSHGGEGSSQGFGQWHMGNQSQDEVFLAAQEAVGAHRDSQDFEICKINKLEDIVIEPEVLENTHGNLLQIKFEELFVPDSETTVTDSICIESDSESESETQHDTNYALPTLLGPSFCYLCKKHISDIAQHLNETHKNNAEVAKILKLPKNSHKYVEGLRKIKRWGDFFYNCIVIKSQKGTLNIDHSRFKKLKKSSSYGPCPDCLEFMPKTEIVTHLKNQCPENQNGLIANRHPEIESRAVMYSLLTSSLEKDFAMLVKTLGSDQIAQICRNDSLILIYGNFLLSTFRSESNSSKEKELGSIRNSMRELGKVLQVIKAQSKHSKDIPTLSKYLQIKFFDKIIQAVCCASAVHLCQRKDTGLPPVVTKLGKSIRECVALERGKALREVNVKRNEKLVKFWNCMSEHWTSENLLREFIKTKEKTSVQTRKTKNRTSV